MEVRRSLGLRDFDQKALAVGSGLRSSTHLGAHVEWLGLWKTSHQHSRQCTSDRTLSIVLH
jgi:hypothetical protein